MAKFLTFLISAGEIENEDMAEGASALSYVWGCELIKHSTEEPPNEVLKKLTKNDGLVQLDGDPGIITPGQGSWLDAIGAWRKPAILIVKPLASGAIPGSAAAYTALCKELKIPLLGIVQLGGAWNPISRKQECLPWCGKIGLNKKEMASNSTNISSNCEEAALILKARLESISN